jgi:hypothetical protein
MNLSHNLPKVPDADKNNLAALQAHGGQLFQAAAAYFNGLAGPAAWARPTRWPGQRPPIVPG